MGTIKIAILEKDGTEFDSVVEFDLASALAHIGFVGNTNNFSYNFINNNTIIPLYQQMLVYQECEIGLGYELDIIGELVILD